MQLSHEEYTKMYHEEQARIAYNRDQAAIREAKIRANEKSALGPIVGLIFMGLGLVFGGWGFFVFGWKFLVLKLLMGQ